MAKTYLATNLNLGDALTKSGGVADKKFFLYRISKLYTYPH